MNLQGRPAGSAHTLGRDAYGTAGLEHQFFMHDQSAEAVSGAAALRVV
jgi:hypothetical protein